MTTQQQDDSIVALADEIVDLHYAGTRAEIALAAIKAGMELERAKVVSPVASSIEMLQRRGLYADTILWAVSEYDEWMKDDDYDSHGILRRIIDRLRERVALILDERQGMSA